jgi:2'-5' RNA ligase
VNEAAAGRLRLFFALWPSDACRAALALSAAPAILAIDGVPVPPGNLHVTLAFLGSVPGRSFVGLVEVGGRVRGPAVELAFDRVEYWAKPKVAVAMPGSIPESGREIEEGLWRHLAPLGFEREDRPWRPHLTLVRKVRRPPPDGLRMAPVEVPGGAGAWRLALVESSTRPEGVRYKPLADWPLAGGDSPL